VERSFHFVGICSLFDIVNGKIASVDEETKGM